MASPASKRQKDSQFSCSLQDTVIIISGGTQGQGRECACMAAKMGARGIAVCGRNAENGAKVVAEIEALGAECLFVRCDVGDPEQITAVVAQTDARFGRIDGLVNCAGDTTRGDLESTDADEWDRLMRINLRSHFLFTQAVARVMKRDRTRGSIVNIASVQAYGGLTFCLGYAVAKAGLVAMTKNNAAELGPHGIKVNAVNMGWTVTDNEMALQSAQAGEGWVAAADKSVPLGRISRPADIAKTVMFLLGDAYTTGAIIEMHPEYIHGMLGGAIGKASDLSAET